MMRTLLARLRGQAIAITALCVALGGTSYAATQLPKDSVSGTQIKSGAVGSSEVKNNSLKGSDVKNKSLTLADFTGSVKGPAGPTGAQGATGPAGAQGKQGQQGPQGQAGTARAYVFVNSDNCALTTCTFSTSTSKGVSAVTRPDTGEYCVSTPQLSPATAPALVTEEFSTTDNPEASTGAYWERGVLGADCPANAYHVVTERLNTTAVRNAAGNGTETVLDDGDDVSNTVSFVIAIP